MRDHPYLAVILIGLLTMLAAFSFQEGNARTAEALDVDPVIWSIEKDYPETLPGDMELPIRTVYVKTHDGSDWMSTYDGHPFAVSGPEAIKNLIDIYGDQNIQVAAWFNPIGTDYAAQLEIAKQVIDSGVTALYADVEPYTGFCYLHCKDLADNLWKPLREARPYAKLGVIYDPRPWWWEQSAITDWLSVADAALPMCYWDDYTNQGVFNDPAGCVLQAHADLAELAPGQDLSFIPMLQGNSTAKKFQQALDAAASVGSEKVSVWRRGVVNTEVWELIGQYQEPDYVTCRTTLADGCLFREVSDSTVYLMVGGAKIPFGDKETFEGMGYSFNDVQAVEDGFLGGIPDVPRDGTLVRGVNSPDIWLVLAGGRFKLAEGDFEALGLNPIYARKLADSMLNEIPIVPNDFSRLREYSQTDEYLIIRGMRLRIDSEVEAALQVLGISGGAKVVPDLALEAFPIATVGRGDADCSGDIAPMDVLQTLRLSSQLPNGAVCYQSADVNCDGEPASVDALLILVFVTGKSSLVPGCEPVGTLSALE